MSSPVRIEQLRCRTASLEMTSEEWHALLDVSLHGAFYTLREATRRALDDWHRAEEILRRAIAA